jgi:hypothetical protein
MHAIPVTRRQRLEGLWFKASQGKKLGKHISINKPGLIAVPAIQEAESRRIIV